MKPTTSPQASQTNNSTTDPMPRKKLITKAELKGIRWTHDIEWLLEEINRKGDISGYHFSSWWFDFRHSKEDNSAMDAIIWQLIVNNVEKFGFRFNDKTEAQLRLKETATFIGNKLNGVWWETIVKWLRSMSYDGYGVTVNDQCGLDTLYIKLTKNKK